MTDHTSVRQPTQRLQEIADYTRRLEEIKNHIHQIPKNRTLQRAFQTHPEQLQKMSFFPDDRLHLS